MASQLGSSVQYDAFSTAKPVQVMISPSQRDLQMRRHAYPGDHILGHLMGVGREVGEAIERPGTERIILGVILWPFDQSLATSLSICRRWNATHGQSSIVGPLSRMLNSVVWTERPPGRSVARYLLVNLRVTIYLA